MGQNFKAFISSRNLDAKENTFTTEADREILVLSN
jgi:hypothetical protein